MNKAVLIALGAVWAGSACGQTVVYDNTTTSLDNNFPLLHSWTNDSVEGGDEIWLGGTDRVATELTLLMTHRGVIPGTVDARIRFRYFDTPNNAPSTVFYDSGQIEDLAIASGINSYTFAIPSVTVPDHFVWTIQLSNRQGAEEEFGPAYFNPPTIGHSDDFFWLLGSGNEWAYYSWGGDPYANFGAKLTAVPEPGTLLCLGMAALGLRRRKSRA